jgi:hypothetical protein
MTLPFLHPAIFPLLVPFFRLGFIPSLHAVENRADDSPDYAALH